MVERRYEATWTRCGNGLSMRTFLYGDSSARQANLANFIHPPPAHDAVEAFPQDVAPN